jgi:O-antigen/teichoic acid export membrane protein
MRSLFGCPKDKMAPVVHTSSGGALKRAPVSARRRMMSANTRSESPAIAGPSRGLSQAVRGFGALAASSVAGQLLGFVALAYVARRVGATNLGAYAFALALATYFGLLSTFGINNLATRDAAKDRNALRSTVSETLLLQLALAIGMYGLLVTLSQWLVGNVEARQMVPIVGLTLIVGSFTLDWALVALGRFNAVAFWRFAGQAIYVGLIPLLVVSGKTGVFRYAWLNVAGLAITAVGLATVAAHTRAMRPRGIGLRAVLTRLRRSVPFGYSLIMIQIYAAIDSLMLGYLDSTHAVGIYAVANKLPAALIVFANVWINAFLPHTARRLTTDPQGLARDLGRLVTATLSIAAAICVGSFISANRLMPLMFGEDFRAASAPFSFLAIAGALVLIQANFSNVLRGQRYYTIVMTLAAITIVVLNLVLIPLAGPLGSAIATAIGEVGLTLLTFVGVRRKLGPLPIDVARLVRAACAVIVMTIFMLAAPVLNNSVVVQICVGLVAFAGAAFALRVFDASLLIESEALSG